MINGSLFVALLECSHMFYMYVDLWDYHGLILASRRDFLP